MVSLTADEVIVALDARLGDYNTRISQAERHFTRNMDKIQGSASRIERAVATSMRNMAGALGLVSTVALARGLLTIADEAKNLTAQLQLATAQTGSFAVATDDVRRIAESTRSGLTETATLYGNFQRNAKELGITQAEAARATETFAKTLTISGSGASESAASIRQFSQALASGVLRGDEFNSIMENSPRLARLLADSLGVPVGALRAMAEEGQLTADKLTRALTDQKFTAGIDEEFKQMPVTFDQAMQQVHNAAIITFGAFDRGGEFSTALANFITQGTDGFAELERSAEAAGIDIRAAFEGLHDAFQPMVSGAMAAFATINGQAVSTRDSIASLLGALDSVANALPRLGNAAKRFDNRVFGTNWQTESLSNMQGRFTKGYDAAQSRQSSKLILDKVLGPTALRDFFRKDAPVGGGARPAPAAKGGGRKGPSAETLERRAEAQRLAAERREQAFADELAGLNADLLAARSALVQAADIRAELERQEIRVGQEKYNDSLASQVTQKKLTHAQADQLRSVNDQVVAERLKAVDIEEEERLQRQRLEARRAALDLAAGDIENERDMLNLQSRLAETAAERRAIELRLIDLAYAEERLRLEAIRDMERSNDAAEEARREAQREGARRRLGTLPGRQAAEREGARRGTMGPLDTFISKIPDTAAEIDEALERVAANGLQSVVDGLAEAGARFLKLGGIAGQVANQIIADLIRIAVQQAVLATMAGGSPLGGIAKLFGGFFADGGRPPMGKVSVVGERGPELFVPDQAGTIVPMGKNIKQVGGNVQMPRPQMTVISAPQFDLRHAITTPALMQEVHRVSQAHAARAATAMGQGVMRAMPSRLAQFQSDGI